MNQFIFTGKEFLSYLLKAKDEHSIHSPFVYEFYTQVVKGRTDEALNEVWKLRTELKNNHQIIEVTDFGAGSKTAPFTHRKISSIVKSAEKSPALASLIYRIVKFRKPKVVLDLGTSLGITTACQSLAFPDSKLYSFEGCPNIAELAKVNFSKLNCRNVHVVVGNLDETLGETLKGISEIDFVYVDANHRYEPTLRYFNSCLGRANEDSIFVFDDIYWSPEMKRAWEEIKSHPAVGITIDLFHVGIVFFRKKQPVQHFTLR